VLVHFAVDPPRRSQTQNTPRLLDIILRNQADDMITVREWEHPLLRRDSELPSRGPGME